MLNKTAFTENLKKRRKELGISQYAMAEQLGIARETYINWENNITMPIEKLYAICDILDCDIRYLNGETEYTSKEKEVAAELLGLSNESISEWISLGDSEKEVADILLSKCATELLSLLNSIQSYLYYSVCSPRIHDRIHSKDLVIAQKISDRYKSEHDTKTAKSILMLEIIDDIQNIAQTAKKNFNDSDIENMSNPINPYESAIAFRYDSKTDRYK